MKASRVVKMVTSSVMCFTTMKRHRKEVQSVGRTEEGSSLAGLTHCCSPFIFSPKPSALRVTSKAPTEVPPGT